MSDFIVSRLEQQEKNRKLTPTVLEKIKELLKTESLYKEVPVELATSLEALYPEVILLYCIVCKAERPFHDSIPIRQKIFPTDEKEMTILTGVYMYDYVCTGCKGSFYCYVFVDFEANSIQKIGQKPSVADLLSGELSKYRKILKGKYSEFSKAIGLKAHGIGVGSFVYLRRIFEDLIDEAHLLAQQAQSWNESAYQQARMNEKILLLKDNLPQALVNNASLYSILSKGIHSLTEDECLTYFDTLKVGIELILDEKIERKEREEKTKRMAAEIARIKGELS